MINKTELPNHWELEDLKWLDSVICTFTCTALIYQIFGQGNADLISMSL